MSMSEVRCPVSGHRAYPFSRDPRAPLEYPAELKVLRREQPVTQVELWNGNRVWLVTGFADARSVLRDPRLSISPKSEKFPMISPALLAIKGGEASFRTMDPPKHTEHRRMWAPFFASMRIKAMLPGIQQIIDAAIDRMVAQGNSADLIADFALNVPSHVIGHLLAVPESDHDFFQREYMTFLTITNTPEQIRAAADALNAFWLEKIEERVRRPGDDIVSEIIVKYVLPGELTRQELAAMCQLMLRAGHETTANMIGLGTLVLLQNPDQLAEIRKDLSLMSGAVDEMMRYFSIAQFGLSRVAAEDIEVGGVTIPKGDGVIVQLLAANHDETEFPDPDKFDIHRAARHHLGFGAGIHLCMGAPLAKNELEMALTTLFTRLPSLRLAVDPGELRYKVDGMFFGLHALPVKW